MTKADQAIQSVAHRLERLVAARAKATTPARWRSAAISPWLVIAGAFAGGYLAAKVIDWRSHAHPR